MITSKISCLLFPVLFSFFVVHVHTSASRTDSISSSVLIVRSLHDSDLNRLVYHNCVKDATCHMNRFQYRCRCDGTRKFQGSFADLAAHFSFFGNKPPCYSAKQNPNICQRDDFNVPSCTRFSTDGLWVKGVSRIKISSLPGAVAKLAQNINLKFVSVTTDKRSKVTKNDGDEMWVEVEGKKFWVSDPEFEVLFLFKAGADVSFQFALEPVKAALKIFSVEIMGFDFMRLWNSGKGVYDQLQDYKWQKAFLPKVGVNIAEVKVEMKLWTSGPEKGKVNVKNEFKFFPPALTLKEKEDLNKCTPKEVPSSLFRQRPNSNGENHSGLRRLGVSSDLCTNENKKCKSSIECCKLGELVCRNIRLGPNRCRPCLTENAKCSSRSECCSGRACRSIRLGPSRCRSCYGESKKCSDSNDCCRGLTCKSKRLGPKRCRR